MFVLIQILGQIIIIAAVLKVIFILLDKAIAIYKRRLRFSANRQRNGKKMRSRNPLNPKITKNSYHNVFVGRAWNQLLIRLQFDIPTAERLINSLRLKYPGESERWYIEKAIQDLDRDRGR